MGKGKKSGNAGLGKSLIKDKTRSKHISGDASWLHTSELGDGYEWGRLNLRSVTEESTLDDFLRTAELAGTEFQAERMNAKIVAPQHSDLQSEEERQAIRKAQEENKQYLSIPRRPTWDVSTSAEKLDLMERESFLAWRRGLALLQENEDLVLTPFEKNLEFWRQLWRVIERSDVVVQIVDARNPLLYRCEDLERYVKEMSPHKVNAVLMNKSDLLTEAQSEGLSISVEVEASVPQLFNFFSKLATVKNRIADNFNLKVFVDCYREMWANYFKSISLPCAFWSATGIEGQQMRLSSDEVEEVAEDDRGLEDDEGSEVDEKVDGSDVEQMELVSENRYEALGVEGGERSGSGVDGGEKHPPTTVWREDTSTLGLGQLLEADDQDAEVDSSIPHDQRPPMSGAPAAVGLVKESKDAPQPLSLCASAQAEGQDSEQSLEMMEQPGTANEGSMQDESKWKVLDDGGGKVIDEDSKGKEIDDDRGKKGVDDGEGKEIDDGVGRVLDAGRAKDPCPSSVLDASGSTVVHPPSAEGGEVAGSGSEAALPKQVTVRDKHVDEPPCGTAQPMEVVSPLQSRVLTRQELLDFFRAICQKKHAAQRLQVGLVGYPNVGKSSTINVLYQEKKTPVSATPGRTKHFQTLLVDDDICLCDSPGLVFPSFVNTKAEMICSGILPIDQMRDPIPPVTLVCQRLPRHVLCSTYGLYLPPPEEEGAGPNDPPTALELLAAYAFERGFMTHKGNPDQQRAARHILKDYVSGKLLYCHPPPGVTPEDFNPQLYATQPPRCGDWGKTQTKVDSILATTVDTGLKPNLPRKNQEYLSQGNVEVVSKGAHGLRGFTRTEGFVHHHGLLATGVAGEMEEEEEEGGSTVSGVSGSHLSYSSATRPGVGDKPWKRHHNRNKKEKVRRQVKMQK